MRITVTSSGGWAGLSLRREVDTEDLPGEDAAELDAAIDAAIGAQSGVGTTADQHLRDARWYHVETSDGRSLRVQEISCGEHGLTLIAALRRHLPVMR